MKKWLSIVGPVVSFALFVAALTILYHKLHQVHLSQIRDALLAIAPWALAAAGALTLADYAVLTLYDRLALRYLGQRQRYRDTALASFVGYVFSHNASFVGGSAARFRMFTTLGVSVTDVAKLVVFDSVTFWLGFCALVSAGFGLGLFSIPEKLGIALGLVRGATGLLGLGVAGYLVALGIRRGPLTIGGRTLSLPSFGLGLGQVLVSAADWSLAAAVPYVLLPISGVSYGYFLGVFLLAQMAGVLSAVPGGLGVVETVAVFLLSDRMDSTTVVGTLLVYRILYYLGPLVVASGILGAVEIAGRYKLKWLQAPGRVVRAVSTTFVPYVISFLVFLGGLILMVSGSLASDPGRLRMVRKIVPLPAIEMSHFIGSVLGAGLLILCYGLQRRLRVSYYLVLAFLAGGIATLLVKGLHIEEALVLLLFLALMIPCRNHFYRKASLLTQPFSTTWVLWMLAALTGTIWITLFSYRHVPYSSELWWQFAFDAHAPRSMRAATASAVILLAYAMFRLLLPAPLRKASLPDETEKVRIRELVEACPRSSANLALLPDKRFVWSSDGKAFIMYAIEGRSWIAMGDPVGAEESWADVIWRFRDLCDRYSGWPVFYQIGRETLGYYTDLGLGFHKLGEEARVELAGFSLEGNRARDFRNTRNKMRRQGYRMEIVPAEEVPSHIESMEQISRRWLSIKHAREKRFSLGYFDRAYLSQTPAAVVRDDQQILAFSNLWLSGGREELSVDLMRYDPESGHGVMDFLFVELMLWGQQEGYRWFNLGMAPLSGLERRRQAPLWQRVGGLIYRHAEHFYNFQGLYQYKSKFNPQWSPRYLACPRGWQLPTILANLIALISGGMSGTFRK